MRAELLDDPAGCTRARCYAALAHSVRGWLASAWTAPPPSPCLVLFEEPPMRIFALLLAAVVLQAQVGPAVRYDVAISGGRVMDPETGLDAARNIGIRGGTIEAITVESLQAANNRRQRLSCRSRICRAVSTRPRSRELSPQCAGRRDLIARPRGPRRRHVGHQRPYRPCAPQLRHERRTRGRTGGRARQGGPGKR